MKIVYMKLINYIGIYNGLGLGEIEINLNKSKNRLILIRGLNGSGKTTIHSAMSPVPDSNDSIIKEQQGSKFINIINKGYLYKIKITYPVKKNGERDTVKAFIKKDNGGIETELNPNGNVTSYKEVIALEFGLDSNFESLSRLSTEDKGIASKTPSERKKFANDILKELSDYNNIYKAISKRASMFKVMVNRLETKIEQIGDPELIKGSLSSIDNRLMNMNKERSAINEKIANINARISLHDPNNSIQERSSSIYLEIDEINHLLKCKYDELAPYDNIIRDMDSKELNNKISILGKEIVGIDTNILNLENIINSSLNERELSSAQIQKKSSKLQSIMDDNNHNSIINSIQELNDTIANWDRILIKMGYDINGEINLTKDEYLLGISTLKEIKEIISTFRSGMEWSIIQDTINNYISKGHDASKELPKYQKVLSDITDSIRNLEASILVIHNEIKMMETLNFKPEECDMYHCSFIFEAHLISETDPISRLQLAEEELKDLLNNKKDSENDLSHMMEIVECSNYINRIVRLISNNNGILRKLPNNEGFKDKHVMLDRILRNDQFDEIIELQKYVQYCDIFNLYNTSKSKLNRLNSDLKLYESREELSNEILDDIELLNNSIKNLDTDTEQFRTTIFEKKKERLSKSTDLDNLNEASIIISDINIYEDKKKSLLYTFNSIKDSMKVISDHKDKLELYSARVNAIDLDLPSINENRDTLNYNLRQLNEYSKEYEGYLSSYNKVQEIKYHSSPTTGIQLIFIRLYMNQTISLANKLLGMLFDGEYYIEPFIINEKEFRIPCRGSGILNDDISSMSTGQISMISMVLSFVMLKQAATEYNILKLDEIDAGLDSINRVKFLNLLEKQMDMLDVEQCLMISHNPELDISGCDFILLKMDESERASIVNSDANIIYSY